MKPWMIPTEYMGKEIERQKRQDEVMAAAGWVKIQSGMWVKPSPEKFSETSGQRT